jgi:maleate isomerase
MSRVFLGMLTPSSNTILEPLTSRMLAGLPEVTAHFGRFRVTEISMSAQAQGQFAIENPLAAAELLADAKCRSICWNGTSSAWLGFHTDRELCAAITARTGIAACSSVLAIEALFRTTRVRRFGLVSPYIDDIQQRIVANFAREGYECVADERLGISVNFDFSETTPAQLERMIRSVARARPDAITVMCTNLGAAPLVERLEAELGIPIYDSIATALWASLRTAGVDPARVTGYGQLFRGQVRISTSA